MKVRVYCRGDKNSGWHLVGRGRLNKMCKLFKDTNNKEYWMQNRTKTMFVGLW